DRAAVLRRHRGERRRHLVGLLLRRDRELDHRRVHLRAGPAVASDLCFPGRWSCAAHSQLPDLGTSGVGGSYWRSARLRQPTNVTPRTQARPPVTRASGAEVSPATTPPRKLPTSGPACPITDSTAETRPRCESGVSSCTIRSEERRVGKECRARWWTHE